MKKKFEDKIIPLIEEIFEMEKEYYYVKCSRRSYEQKHNGDKPNCGKYICDGKVDCSNYKFNLFDHFSERWRERYICKNCGGYTKSIFKKDKAYHWREDSEGFINECRTEEYVKWERLYRKKMRKIDTEISKIEKEKKSLNEEGRILAEKIMKLSNRRQNIEKKEIKKFIHACPKEDCRGFLSTQWKCGVCDSKVCKECFKIKNNKSDKEHVCNPDDIETVKLIKSSTKPCPKCATAISKINGCDQMWCINCKVAFSWKKGTIEVVSG